MHGTVTKRVEVHPQGASSENFAASSRASVVTTYKQRERWLHRVSRDRRMTTTYRHVLCALARCARYDENSDLIFDPTYDEIAEEAACSRSTAIRAVSVAKDFGIVRIAMHSDGRTANTFDLLLPNSVNDDKNTKNLPEKPKEIQCPTVSNFHHAHGSNGVTADTV
jgi:hypothetical protein